MKSLKVGGRTVRERVGQSIVSLFFPQAITRELIVPGSLMIALICLLRFSGFLQMQEWMLLDSFSRQCSRGLSEQNLSRAVTLITVDEADYQTVGFPLSADVLAQTLTNLQAYQPRVIGLDIFRDLPQGQGENLLRKVLASMPNVVVAEVSLSEEPMMNVEAPVGASPERVGFADSMVDKDGKIRRIVLAVEEEGSRKESLALMLAKAYLKADNVDVDGLMPPRFSPYSGGYVRANSSLRERKNATEYQMLMNFCLLQRPYETVSLRAVLQGRVDAQKIRDRVVLIGKASTSPRDSFITSAVSQTLYSRQIVGENDEQALDASAKQTNYKQTNYRSRATNIVYGVEVHGYATEQIIDFAFGRRSALVSWPELVEYLWIAAWGVLGVWFSVRFQSPLKSTVALIVMTLLLSYIGYSALMQSLWIPVVPAALALWSAGLITAFFDRDIRFELVQRRATIERTYEAVHNGPLQRLAEISRGVRSTPRMADASLLTQLQQLNEDMRNIFERLRLDTFTRKESLYLSDTVFLMLSDPLSELLSQVYEHTLSLPLPGFAQIKVFVTPMFEVLNGETFSIEEKRGLCLFLQEALSNVGRHAVGATRLDVSCILDEHSYRLQIVDDGVGFRREVEDSQGTRQARAIAQRLSGQFYRAARQPTGIFCELSWPSRSS